MQTHSTPLPLPMSMQCQQPPTAKVEAFQTIYCALRERERQRERGEGMTRKQMREGGGQIEKMQNTM